MKRISMIFKAPFEIDITEQALPGIGVKEVLVKTEFSAISQGTEMLLYRGLFPDELVVDETISELRRPLRYPLQYGYCAVGKIIQAGAEVSQDFLGKTVFCLHPHESCFSAGVDEILPIPNDIHPRDALFLANMEAAVNFLMDGRPIIGEKVVVLGQGVVGLLTAALLAKFPVAALVTLDNFALRREASLSLGAHLALDPAAPEDLQKAIEHLEPGASEGSADLIYELSGNPEALNTAIAMAVFDGRIVIGSWFGRQRAALDLGGRFHRKRIRLISSQVSTVTTALSARWSKQRRFDVAWDMIRKIKPARLITHQIPFLQVKEAFELIDRNRGSTIQVVLEYDPR